jgi:putative oxidoreductase
MDQRIPLSLLLLRIGVFIVMLMWTLDKFFNPGHAGKVYEGFYGISMTGETVMALIGAAELVLIVAFVAGAFRRVTYGAVLILHGISTLSSWSQYLNPFDNLLFFAAWPMLAACIALYLLRDLDTRWSVDALRSGG